MEDLYAMVEPISDELAYQYNYELAMWELKEQEERIERGNLHEEESEGN